VHLAIRLLKVVLKVLKVLPFDHFQEEHQFADSKSR